MNHKIGCIYKELGISSFQALWSVKKKLNTKKLGHMGTLDPLAEGCLPFAANGLTALIPYVPKLPKVYDVEVYFGFSTPSIDAEGLDLNLLDYQKVDINYLDLENFLKSLIPAYSQIPPNFSAKKVNGKRAYDLVRNGVEFELKSKQVDFFDFKILSFENPILKMQISCGEGFYVRSLVRDISEFLKIDAFMYSLKRKQVGVFDVNQMEAGEIKFFDLREVFPSAFFIDLNKEDYEKLKFGIAPELKLNNKDFIFAFYNAELVYYKILKDNLNKQRFLISEL